MTKAVSYERREAQPSFILVKLRGNDYYRDTTNIAAFYLLYSYLLFVLQKRHKLVEAPSHTLVGRKVVSIDKLDT